MGGNQGAVITLPESVSIEKAENLKKKLEKIQSSYSSLVLDFHKVETIDAAGIQLLSAFALDCVNRSIEFGCLGPVQDGIRGNMVLAGILVNREGEEYLFPFIGQEGVKIEFSG